MLNHGFHFSPLCFWIFSIFWHQFLSGSHGDHLAYFSEAVDCRALDLDLRWMEEIPIISRVSTPSFWWLNMNFDGPSTISQPENMKSYIINSLKNIVWLVVDGISMAHPQ